MSRPNHRRRGTAPLEVVLAFPLLVTLVAGMLWVGKAGAARSVAIADARGRAWEARDEAAAGRVLRLPHDPAASAVEEERADPLPGKAPFSGRGWTAHAVTGASFNPWAADMIEFAELPDANREIRPHLDLLKKVGRRNPETLAEYTGLIGRLAPAPIDPLKNGAVRAVFGGVRRAAAELGALRKSDTIRAQNIPDLLQAIAGLEKLAASDWFLAWWYEYEAAVVGFGVAAAGRLIEAIEPPK